MKDIKKFGIIDKYNGNSHLPHWTTPECNHLNGTDGSIFPPHITKNTTLNLYDKDLCRLLPLSFEKEVITKDGVPGYRFTPDEKVFASVESNPDNMCFCPAGPPCAPHGMFNVSLCQYGKCGIWNQCHPSQASNSNIGFFISRFTRFAQLPTFLSCR